MMRVLGPLLKNVNAKKTKANPSDQVEGLPMVVRTIVSYLEKCYCISLPSIKDLDNLLNKSLVIIIMNGVPLLRNTKGFTMKQTLLPASLGP